MSELMAYVWRKTGELRPPLKGETFVGYRGLNTARFSFTVQSFEILRGEKVLAASVAHAGDPCIYCGKEHDKVPLGPCHGLVYDGVFLEEVDNE